jgi:hypothetical protein
MRKGGSEMKTVSGVLFALLLVSFGQAQERWTKTYGGTVMDQGYSAQQTSDGGCIVTGFTNSFGAGDFDAYLIKTNAAGDTLWTRTYGGTLKDYGNFVRQTSDEGYVVAGYTNSFGAGLNDVYLIKTNASGDTLWTRTFGGISAELANCVQQTSDGGYIVAGWTKSFGAGDADAYLIKTNASGDTLWTRTCGGTSEDEAYSVQPTSDGGYIVAGWTYSFGAGNYDVYLIKTDSAGDTLWTRTYGGAGEDRGYSVQQTTDGGYIMAGRATLAGGQDVWLIKTDASGDTLWTRIYGGTSTDWGFSARQTEDGGYIIAGVTYSAGTGGSDAYLIKTSASGDTLWTKVYGGASNDWGQSVRQTTDGGYVIAGSTESFGAGVWDVYLVKTDADGNAGVEEPGSGRQPAALSVRATPNPFVSFARIPGHEAERVNVYDISGKMVGTYSGNRVGEGLSPAVYFIKLNDKHGTNLRIMKVR